jgi:hypothetical protein
MGKFENLCKKATPPTKAGILTAPNHLLFNQPYHDQKLYPTYSGNVAGRTRFF